MLPEKFVFGERFKLLFKGEKRTGATQHLFLLGIGNHDFSYLHGRKSQESSSREIPRS